MSDEFAAHRLPDDPDPRPFSVRVLSVVGGALGLTGLFLIPLLLMPVDMPSWFDHLWRGPAYRIDTADMWLFASTAAGMALAGVLLAGSIGCLYLRNWGRVLMIAYCIASLLASLASAFAFVRYWPATFGGRSELRGFATWFSVCCWTGATLYSAVMLYFITRPGVREAFKAEMAYPDIPEYET